MNAEELADFVVMHLSEYFYATTDVSPLIQFTPEKPATIGEAEAESQYDSFRVFVTPYGESETKINRGDVCEEHLTVSVVINGPLDDTIDKTLALAFLKQIKRSFRRSAFENYLWRSNDTVTYYSPEAMQKGQFYSVFRAEYFGLA